MEAYVRTRQLRRREVRSLNCIDEMRGQLSRAQPTSDKLESVIKGDISAGGILDYYLRTIKHGSTST